MNTLFRFFLIAVFSLTLGCKPITKGMFGNNNIHKVEMLTIGFEDISVFKHTFNSVGFVTLSAPIKLEVTTGPFTKSAYNGFVIAKKSQPSSFDITYVDSLEQKPKYLNLKIADVLKLIEQLHEPSNENIKDYLGTNQRAGVVTGLKIAYPMALMGEFQKAASVFLTQLSEANYQFQLTSNDGKTKHIPLKDGVMMEYTFSKPCWKGVPRNDHKIVELIEPRGKCASGAYRSPRFIKKPKEDYFKF